MTGGAPPDERGGPDAGRPGPGLGAASERCRVFAEGLTREERLLVTLRDTLYGGAWDDLEADLTATLGRRPVVFKRNTRIDEDLARISRLRAFEREHGVDLASLLDLPGGSQRGRTP